MIGLLLYRVSYVWATKNPDRFAPAGVLELNASAGKARRFSTASHIGIRANERRPAFGTAPAIDRIEIECRMFMPPL
jgi:hypothetical protein